MKKSLIIIFGVLMSFIIFNNGNCIELTRVDQRILDANNIVDQLMMIPENKIPDELMKKCSAIAIFPQVFKGGFIVGAKYGQGVILLREEGNKWSYPAFFSIEDASFSFQVGAEYSDLVLLIFGEKTIEGLLKDKFALGADGSIAQGPVGINAQFDMDILLKGGIFSYSRTKGAFSGISLKGGIITPNNVANRDYYGQDISSKEILQINDINLELSQTGKDLLETIRKYTKQEIIYEN